MFSFLNSIIEIILKMNGETLDKQHNFETQRRNFILIKKVSSLLDNILKNNYQDDFLPSLEVKYILLII